MLSFLAQMVYAGMQFSLVLIIDAWLKSLATAADTESLVSTSNLGVSGYLEVSDYQRS